MNIAAHRALIREINAQRRLKHYVEYMTQKKSERPAPTSLFEVLMASVNEENTKGDGNGSLQ